MTTCSTVQSDSKPRSSAVFARCASRSGCANGPELTNISPSLIIVVCASFLTLQTYCAAILCREKLQQFSYPVVAQLARRGKPHAVMFPCDARVRLVRGARPD